MKTETTVQGLNASLTAARLGRKTIGLVPTMGNLHSGHIQLVQEARRYCDLVVVSIFVNPLQFGVGEDFDRYPRTLDEDRKLLVDASCDILFAPTVDQMYQQWPQATLVTVGGLSEELCGAHRPGHFSGVATVVSKLFNIVQPNLAFFGEKDYQQLAVIRRLTADLCFPVEIIGVPTIRAADGLALSSRNAYLSPEDRSKAPLIYQTLNWIAAELLAGSREYDNLSAKAVATLKSQGFEPDYVEIRSTDLLHPESTAKEWVILVAAKLGQTRLIDNLLVNIGKDPELRSKRPVSASRKA